MPSASDCFEGEMEICGHLLCGVKVELLNFSYRPSVSQFQGSAFGFIAIIRSWRWGDGVTTGCSIQRLKHFLEWWLKCHRNKANPCVFYRNCNIFWALPSSYFWRTSFPLPPLPGASNGWFTHDLVPRVLTRVWFVAESLKLPQVSGLQLTLTILVKIQAKFPFVK